MYKKLTDWQLKKVSVVAVFYGALQNRENGYATGFLFRPDKVYGLLHVYSGV